MPYCKAHLPVCNGEESSKNSHDEHVPLPWRERVLRKVQHSEADKSRNDLSYSTGIRTVEKYSDLTKHTPVPFIRNHHPTRADCSWCVQKKLVTIKNPAVIEPSHIPRIYASSHPGLLAGVTWIKYEATYKATGKESTERVAGNLSTKCQRPNKNVD